MAGGRPSGESCFCTRGQLYARLLLYVIDAAMIRLAPTLSGKEKRGIRETLIQSFPPVIHLA